MKGARTTIGFILERLRDIPIMSITESCQVAARENSAATATYTQTIDQEYACIILPLH